MLHDVSLPSAISNRGSDTFFMSIYNEVILILFALLCFFLGCALVMIWAWLEDAKNK